MVAFASPWCLWTRFLVLPLKYNNCAMFLILLGVGFVTGPVTHEGAGALFDFEAVMTKTNHIDHTELVQLGKVFLLLTQRQQNTMDFSLSEVVKRVPVVNDLPRAS